MQALFFERPFLLICFLIVTQFILTWAWARSRTPRTCRAALTGLLLFPLLLGLQALVITDRERITTVCREMAESMEAGDVRRIATHVAPTFAAGDMDRAALVEALTRVLTHVHVEEPRLSDFDVNADGDRGRAAFQASCRLVTQTAIQSAMVSRWELRFGRLDGRWQVTEISPLPTPWFPFRSLDEVLRASGK